MKEQLERLEESKTAEKEAKKKKRKLDAATKSAAASNRAAVQPQAKLPTLLYSQRKADVRAVMDKLQPRKADQSEVLAQYQKVRVG